MFWDRMIKQNFPKAQDAPLHTDWSKAFQEAKAQCLGESNETDEFKWAGNFSNNLRMP